MLEEGNNTRRAADLKSARSFGKGKFHTARRRSGLKSVAPQVDPMKAILVARCVDVHGEFDIKNEGSSLIMTASLVQEEEEFLCCLSLLSRHPVGVISTGK